MVVVQLDIIQHMVGPVADGRPLGQLLFRVKHLIRTVAQQKFSLHIPFRTGDDHFCAQLLQQRSGFERALKISADRHNTDIKIADAQRLQEFRVGAVADLGVGHNAQNGVDAVLVFVHRHDLMAELVQLLCDVAAKSTQPDQ